jgi:hypothetical protein
VLPDEIPLTGSLAVPKTVLPLLKVITPVGSVPRLEALIVAVRSSPWNESWEVSVATVEAGVMMKLIGVGLVLEAKLVSAIYMAVTEWGPTGVSVSFAVSASPCLSKNPGTPMPLLSQKFTAPVGTP